MVGYISTVIARIGRRIGRHSAFDWVWATLLNCNPVSAWAPEVPGVKQPGAYFFTPKFSYAKFIYAEIILRPKIILRQKHFFTPKSLYAKKCIFYAKIIFLQNNFFTK